MFSNFIKTNFKALKRVIILVIKIVAFMYLVIALGGYVKTTVEERAEIKRLFTNAPVLPQNFVAVYEKVYPDALGSTMWGYVFKEGFGKADFKYPTRDAAVTYCIYKANGSFWNTTLMAFLVEDYATPQQCLQFNLSHFDFTHNAMGLKRHRSIVLKNLLKI